MIPEVFSDPLEATLLDLLYELRHADFPLILGGGYGLYLRQRQIEASGEASLLSMIPPLRSTNDLDVFLKTEVLADSHRLIPLREALDRLEFAVIPSAKNFQFARKFTADGRDWDIKVDLLTREPDSTVHPSLNYDARRVKPNPSVGIHAHTTPEAVAIEDDIHSLSLTGKRSSGSEFTGVVYLPSAYAFLMMKLSALLDQHQQSSKDNGRKHALDIFSIIALLTESELERTLSMRDRYRSVPQAMEACRIVQDLFGSRDSPGSLRVREHPNFTTSNLPEFGVFLETLTDIFPTPAA